MTVGDLFDLLEEKLRTGEFSRMDTVSVGGETDWYSIDSVAKCRGDEVLISSESLNEDLHAASFGFDDED